MNSSEYKTVMVTDFDLFKEQINQLSELGFIALSSNVVLSTHDDSDYFYFALMVKSEVQTSNDFHYKILDELNEIKFELMDIKNNLKYLKE